MGLACPSDVSSCDSEDSHWGSANMYDVTHPAVIDTHSPSLTNTYCETSEQALLQQPITDALSFLLHQMCACRTQSTCLKRWGSYIMCKKVSLTYANSRGQVAEVLEKSSFPHQSARGCCFIPLVESKQINKRVVFAGG